MNKDRAFGFGIGLLAGAAIGAVLALLYAPKTGKETRHLIKHKANEVVDAVKHKTSGVLYEAKEAVSEVNRRGHAIARAIKS